LSPQVGSIEGGALAKLKASSQMIERSHLGNMEKPRTKHEQKNMF
jgi:hypothetical protein